MRYLGRVSMALLLVCFVAAVASAEKAKTTTVQGKVTAVAADSITVSHGADTTTFDVDATTKIIGKGLTTKTDAKATKGEKLTLADAVANGDSVAVTYHEMDGKKHATVIKVTQKSFTAKP